MWQFRRVEDPIPRCSIFIEEDRLRDPHLALQGFLQQQKIEARVIRFYLNPSVISIAPLH